MRSDTAIEYYRNAIRLKPDYPNAHFNLGMAYEKKGLIDKAITGYRITLRFNPYNEAARHKLELIAGHKKGEK
ncbi:MAG: tetratricopeptide repeat protein [Nitrospirae bacterium]|nr:tetratricopeptide repeat protein [Nitrospirota bacterium]